MSKQRSFWMIWDTNSWGKSSYRRNVLFRAWRFSFYKSHIKTSNYMLITYKLILLLILFYTCQFILMYMLLLRWSVSRFILDSESCWNVDRFIVGSWDRTKSIVLGSMNEEPAWSSRQLVQILLGLLKWPGFPHNKLIIVIHQDLKYSEIWNASLESVRDAINGGIWKHFCGTIGLFMQQ